MVIVPSRVGQLGNQLFHIAHFAASAIEHGYQFHYAAFEYPLKHLPMLNSHPCVRVTHASDKMNLYQHRLYKILSKTLDRSAVHRCLTASWPKLYNLDDPQYITWASSKLVLCQGFAFRDFKQVKKHHAELVELFKMSESITSAVDNFEEDAFAGENCVRVGFHIRRGDYMEYEQGKYYINDDQWRRTVNLIKKDILASGRRFVGIIFSNENVDSLVEDTNDLIKGPGGLFTDIEMLSRCDLIVAPPSTYSGWASFIGQVPLIHISKNEAMLPNAQVVEG